MKFSQYNLYTKCKDGMILFNVRLSKYVKLKDEESINHFEQLNNGNMPLNEDDPMVKALIQNGYIINDEIDEYSEAQNDLANHLESYQKSLHLLLYVTEQCNFRCVYCPEEHLNKTFSDENWEALYKHIKNGVMTKKYESIDVSFFGGEPLLETQKIIPFLEKVYKLKELNSQFEIAHSITTNGYLLTPDIYDKLTEFGMCHFQITVDGFADTHDKMRPLAGGQPTWEKIIENLMYINSKKDDVVISLRTNYNSSNIDSLNKYKEWQKKTFDDSKFEFLYQQVAKLSKHVPDEHVNDSESDKTTEITEDLSIGNKILKPFSYMCNSSYPNYYTISVDGNISICENLTGGSKDLFVGHLDSSGEFVFNDSYNAWVSDFETKDCRDCLIYPVCCARACPTKKVFSKDRQDCKIMKDRYVNRMLHFVQNKM